MSVWIVLIDEDMTMRSSPEIKKVFATEKAAEFYIKKYREKWPDSLPDIILREFKVIMS